MTSLEPPQVKTDVLNGNVFTYFWATWMRTIWSLLGYQNCRTEAFTPVTTGVTITSLDTLNAHYNVFRDRFNFSIDVYTNASVSISAGATIDLKNLNKFTLIPKASGYVVISDLGTNSNLGMGVIQDGIAYLPSTSRQNVAISGFYLIEETK